MSLFEQIGLDMGYILIGVAAVCLILLIFIIILFVKHSKLVKKYNIFMKGADGNTLEKAFENKFDEMVELQNDVQEAKRHLERIDKTLLMTFQKIGVVKYDAFKETGGQLSFVVVLLTKMNNGIMINAMHSSREGCYTYAKEIKDGEAGVVLSEEERKALDYAINSNF